MTPMFGRGGVPGRTPLRAPLCGVILLVGVIGCSSSPDSTGTDRTVQPVVPTVSGTAPTRAPALTLAPPAPGTVQIEPGPFSDRLDITGASLHPGDIPVVTAQLRNAVDVSGLILLELRADFFDAAGGYLGSGAAAYADQEFADSGATPLPHGTGANGDSFVVTVPSDAPLAGVSSAVLTIPQLVNE